jgi:hypothetical protein
LAGHPSLQEVLGPCEDDFRGIKIFLLKRFVILNGVGASPPQNCTQLLYIKTSVVPVTVGHNPPVPVEGLDGDLRTSITILRTSKS